MLKDTIISCQELLTGYYPLYLYIMNHRYNFSRIFPPVLLAVLLFILCSQFSYFGDDWFWGTDSRISSFIDSFTDPDNPFHFYNNGRYFGNGLGFITANHKIVRDLIMTAALWLIIAVTAKIDLETAGIDVNTSVSLRNLMIFLCGTVLLLCPKEMFRESIGWSVAFMNYVVPSALYIIGIQKLYTQKENTKTNLTFFILPFLSSFFIENLTIGNTIFIIFWIGFRLIKKGKPSGNEWFYLSGSVIGLVLMFSDDGYRQILMGNPQETYWAAQTGSLMTMVTTGIYAFRNFISNAIVGWMDLLTSFGAISFMFACLLMKEKTSKKTSAPLLLMTVTDTVIAFYFILQGTASSWQAFFAYTQTIESIMAAIFLISQPFIIILLPYSENQKKNLIFTWLFAALATLPLVVAQPLSLREFFPTSVFLLLLYSQITCINIKIVKNNISGSIDRSLFPYVISIFLAAWGYLFSVYAVIAHYEKERIKYVRYQESLGNYDTIFPTLPYEDYVIVSYPWEKTWQERYKKFNDLNLDMNFTIVSFEEWKKSL